MNKFILLVVSVIFFKISGHDHVPADTYKVLFGQLEVAYEDLMTRFIEINTVIKEKDKLIIQLTTALKNMQSDMSQKKEHNNE